ncbi:SH3 domain-binding protein 5-like isoform X3 [Oryctolagus cuniculus]|uniref:SH3 domain-binding protein 5-like isoform X3 n=1 Tax=Oryctolagus cuniculus TaxID=9986 RepID=UPI0038790135
MAEFRQAPGGRETPQGELRPEAVEEEVPRSPGAEEPGGGGGGSGEAKLSPREEEELDPRIQEELEHLNQASEEINQVELQLDEARTTYRRILQESARKLNAQGSQLGSCIEKARPYYEARRLAKEAQQETQKAALRYERAVSMHNAAREMVFVAEQGVMADKNRLDPTWQEMLNHATCKVNEAEEERLRGEREHQRVTRLCQQAEARVQALQKTLRRAIGKSRPYFELKAQFSQILEFQGPALWRSGLTPQSEALASIWAPVLVLAVPLPVRLSAMAWDSSGGCPKSLGPCTHVGDPEEASGSWLRICIALAITAN